MLNNIQIAKTTSKDKFQNYVARIRKTLNMLQEQFYVARKSDMNRYIRKRQKCVYEYVARKCSTIYHRTVYGILVPETFPDIPLSSLSTIPTPEVS